MTVLGIDLGTTYSCVSYINEFGLAEIIPNERDDRTTPSVVWFDEGRIIVGAEAKEMALVHPDRVCSFVKRHIGEDDFTFDCDGKQYSPEEISSFILRKLVSEASKKLGREIKDVVITCPAYFFVKERNATKLAGELAGLNVLRIVNEPTAAAIAYGFSPGEGEREKTMMVYDLGGGTFDVTIIRTNSEEIEVLCTDGDHRLGGKDWDDRLVSLFAEKFREETGSINSPLDSPETLQDLLALAENTKKQLSSKTSTPIRFSHEGDTARFTLTREEFESQTSDLLERTIGFSRSVLEAARKKGVDRIDELLLVGGSSRMPQVTARLRTEFGLEPKLFEPDEAVAKGAAIIANQEMLRELVSEKLKPGAKKSELVIENAMESDVRKAMLETAEELGYTLETVSRSMRTIANVSSKSFGMVAIYGADDTNERISNLIYRNAKLPAEVTDTFSTNSHNQNSVHLRIMENGSERPAPISDEVRNGLPLSEGTLLWEGEMPFPKALPKNSPIDITFRLEADGLLTLIAHEAITGTRFEYSLMTGSSNIDEAKKEREKARLRDLIVE